ncbi:MAG: J domain-containing protein [Clostridium celatum]|nr:J domain-containing protein [Clostridium celatum]
MNYYKVLGIEENATQKEIKEAYNRQVETFKEEVKDEKRLEKFLDLFKEAYDALKYEESILQNQNEEIFDEEVSALFKKNKIEEKPVDISVNKEEVKFENQNIENSYAATVLMSREEILKESLIQGNEQEEERVIFKSKEDFEEGNEFFDNEEEEEDFEEKIIKKIKKKTNYKSRNNNSVKRNRVSKNNKEYNSRDRDRSYNNKEINKNIIIKKEKDSDGILDLLLIPVKILVLPIIAILSILIFICRIISISSWIVAKVIIFGAIAISAIHGYRIYTGQIAKEYTVFVACIIGFIVSIFLPSIVRIVLNILQGTNSSLKNLIF